MKYKELNPYLSNKAIRLLIDRQGVNSLGEVYSVAELKQELEFRMKEQKKREEKKALFTGNKFGFAKYVSNKNVFKYKGL